jgi:phage gp36-like protein
MYVTLLDVQTRIATDTLVYLVDDEHEGLVTPQGEERILAAIRDAVSEVDSYLAQRYSLPVPNVPEILRTKSLDIAEYRVFVRRGIRPNTADESVRLKYKDALLWLKDVATGKASIPFPDGAGGSVGTVLSPNLPKITSASRLFSRESLEDF